MPNYSNTMIYKISCKDKSITDCYVGHTTDINQREKNHRDNCNINHCKSQMKIYKFIHEHGDWDNWEMQIIDHYPQCKTFIEATIREQEWLKLLEPTLNSKKAQTTEEERREQKNAWKRQSEQHHKYSREYSKNLSQDKRDAKNAQAREKRANRTPEQIQADQETDKIRRPRKGAKPQDGEAVSV